MKIFHYDHITFPLPDGHRFPVEKYSILRERVTPKNSLSGTELIVPTPTTAAHLRQAHTDDYIERVLDGRLSPAEIRRIGLPWSPELVERVRYSVGATTAACLIIRATKLI